MFQPPFSKEHEYLKVNQLSVTSLAHNNILLFRKYCQLQFIKPLQYSHSRYE